MTDFGLAKTIEEELLCHLCYDLLNDPRDLDCPHVFCLQCIKKLIGNSITIECPECRHVTFVPTGGMETIKPNLRMRNMVEKFSAHTNLRSGNQNVQLTPGCPYHCNEKINFKCIDCDVPVCQYCIVRQHKRHEIQECSNAGMVIDIKLTINKCQIELQKLNEHLQELSQLEKSIIRDCKLEESKIDERITLLITDLQSKAQLLKSKMNGIKTQKLEILQYEKTLTKEKILRLEMIHASTTKPCQDIRGTTEQSHPSDEIAKCIFKTNASNLHEQFPGQSVITFQNNKHRVTPRWFDIGQIVYRRKLTLSTEFGVGSFRKAQGISVTDNGLLAVADSRANYVEVYRYEYSNYKRMFLLGASDENIANGKITRPLDVAVSNDGKFYVVDSSLVKVYSNNGKYERNFGIGLQDTTSHSEDKSAPQGITTTKNDYNDIIVVADLGRQVITLHEISGAFLRMFKVNTDPRNRIATNGRQIFFTNYQEGKVCSIDFNSGAQLLQLDIPKVTAICCDESSGSILIGRNDGCEGSGVIEQYCMATGKHVARLASDLYAALGMTLTADNRLVVADMISVKVYSII